MIRVGTILNTNDAKNVSYPNFIPIVCMTKSSPYGELGPYVITYKGIIFENLWQFSKVYETVPKVKMPYSRYDRKIIWEHNEEKHVNILNEEEYEILPAYWKWREKGFSCPYPVRYPVGFNCRKNCLFALDEKNNVLDYIEARKELYLKRYIEVVKNKEKFKKLLKMLKDGKNILILEVDGPKEESLPYYKKKYGVKDDFIERKTVLATKENLDIFLNDEKHPFGHGFCLAFALLEEIKK